jgi:hypothetical protein
VAVVAVAFISVLCSPLPAVTNSFPNFSPAFFKDDIPHAGGKNWNAKVGKFSYNTDYSSGSNSACISVPKPACNDVVVAFHSNVQTVSGGNYFAFPPPPH